MITVSGRNGADDTAKVVALVASRSRPKPDRPRLNTESEARLDRIEKESAECYAECELLTFRFSQLADRIGNGEESAPEGDLLMEESGVIHLEGLLNKVER